MAAGIVSVVISLPPELGTTGYISRSTGQSQKDEDPAGAPATLWVGLGQGERARGRQAAEGLVPSESLMLWGSGSSYQTPADPFPSTMHVFGSQDQISS